MTSAATRVRALLGASCLAAGIGIAGAAGAETVLKVIPHADLKNLDPIWTTAYITRNHGYLVWDNLIALNDKLEPTPQMLEGWTISDDGIQYTFTLRDGLRWHDGAEVTAEDAVASLARWSKRDSMGQKLYDFVDKVEAKDKKTFVMTLKSPYGQVLPSIGKVSSNVPFMMPKRLAETDPFQQVPEVVGSGPYIFKSDEWNPGSLVVYTKNPDYKPRSETPSYASGAKVAMVDRVEWHYIPDPETSFTAMVAGEMDYWEAPPPDYMDRLKAAEGVKVAVVDPLGTQGWLRPNHLLPPFDNPKARQALVQMMDQATYMQAIVGSQDYWRTCPAYFMCGTPYELDAGSDGLMKSNLDKAKALMAESGYKGERVVLMQPTDIPLLSGASLVTAQLLRDIGVNVEVQAMDWSTLTSRRAVKDPIDKGGWNIFHTYATGADAASPISNAGATTNCEKAWFGWPCDATADKLRDDFAKETDPKKQMELVKQLQERLYEVVPFVNYGQWYAPSAFSEKLTGVLISPVPLFWNIEKKG